MVPLIAAMVMAMLVAGCIPTTERIAAPPADLSATGDIGQINLTWTVSPGASSYNVKRAMAATGPFSQLAASTSPAYVDAGVSPGTVYFYVVSAVAPGGESGDSAPVSASSVVAPAAPQNLVGTSGDHQVQLSWSESTGAIGYIISRAGASAGPFAVIASTATTSYLDTGLTNGTPYYYRVVAANAAGESAPSASVRVVPNVQNPPPTVFGTWTNVTPSGIDLQSELCSNYGATTIQADPASPSDLYTMFHCQGVWKSTDYGATWAGPINTGTNGAQLNDCSGGISIPPTSTGTPTLYAACIRGAAATGIWKSTDGGVNWTRYTVTPTVRQDYFQPVINPYDGNHLLMAGHEFDAIVESVDGGVTWTSVPLESGMLQDHLSPSVFFIDTGVAASTRRTWLWIGDQAGGANGTWRTTNGGTDWVRVDSNEHVGYAQIYQPDKSGVVYMAGAFSASGTGVLRSADHGQTWDHVGLSGEQSVVFGTTKNVYSMFGYGLGPGSTVDPKFQVGAQPGTGTWVMPGTPASLQQGAAAMAVVNNGTSNIFVGAMWNAGIWRYVEP